MAGIDPGTLVTGYGIVAAAGARVRFIACGTIRTKSGDSLPRRLLTIHEDLRALFRRYRPGECAVESAFTGKNARSALTLGQARGVALLTAAAEGIATAEYAPRAVKKAVVGNGGASKQQVRFMVRSLLGIPAESMPLDASDALAIALCHAQAAGTGTHPARDWASFVARHPERVVP